MSVPSLKPEQLKEASNEQLEEWLKITKYNQRALTQAITKREPCDWDVYYNLYEKKHSAKTSCNYDCSCGCGEGDDDSEEADTDGEADDEVGWLEELKEQDRDKYFIKKYKKPIRMYIQEEYVDANGFVKDEYLFIFDTQSQVCNCPEEEYSRISIAFMAVKSDDRI